MPPRSKAGLISVVVPIYKEEANIRPFLKRLVPVLKGLKRPYEVVFAMDPSSDGTEAVVRQCMAEDPGIRLLIFSRRFGQPAATVGGLRASKGAAVVVIDVDLQDPPELIAELVKKWEQGFDVAYAKRRSRKGETFIKEWVSALGYWVINKISDVKIPRDTGDFRLMSRRVVDAVVDLKESHAFLRGMVAFVGFKQVAVEYDREERASGQGNYNRYLGSLRIGMNGVVGFSSKPLQLVAVVGFGMSALAFVLGAWYVLQKFVFHFWLPQGLSTTVLVVTFFAGMQLVCLGLLGEYVGRIYDEVKQRPLYIVQEEAVAPRGARAKRKAR